MRSDDSEPQPVAPHSPKQRPSWLIWTIVGGAAALVTLAGVGIILAVTNRGTPEVTSSTKAVAAIDTLRSHLPTRLKSAQECEQISPSSYAAATVDCAWGSSSVPRTATYSLFQDNEAMQKSALTRVRDSGYGPSCRSPEDFNANGGKMTWHRDNRERGTLWCYINESGQPEIQWTDTTPKILASAVAPTRQQAGQLLQWFLTAGQASLEPGAVPKPTSATNTPPRPSPPSTSQIRTTGPVVTKTPGGSSNTPPGATRDAPRDTPPQTPPQPNTPPNPPNPNPNPNPNPPYPETT